MARTEILVCLLIMVMDVTAGILGLEADIAQNKVKHLEMWVFECRDPNYKAYKLGLAAAVLLALAHVVGNLFGGCICMWSKEDFIKATANMRFAVASLLFSWIILAVGFGMLFIGAMANSRSRKSCGISHQRVLSTGGILCFIHAFFIISYYVTAISAARVEKLARLEQQLDHHHHQHQHHQHGGHVHANSPPPPA